MLGVGVETTRGLHHVLSISTYEVLHYMPTASVSQSLTRSEVKEIRLTS